MDRTPNLIGNDTAVAMNVPPVGSLFDFSSRVVIVTGGGRGIGSGIAKRFAEASARVVVHFHASGERAAELVAEINAAGGHAIAAQGDLTRAEDAARLLRETVQAFGRADVLINNAGTYPVANLVDMTLAQWHEVMDANLTSTFVCTQAFAQQVRLQGAPGNVGGYAIVNITSIEAENPAPMHAHYDAAKGGVLMLTRVSALELAALNIRVNAVAPGLIWSETLDADWNDGVERWLKRAPLKRLGMPEDVADACLFLASDAARWITGASLLVDGGVMTNQIF